MKWNLNKNKPLTPQISEQICMQIALGELKPNERIYSVREAAMSAGVNPNTVQRAFENLEQLGIIYSVRGSGNYVSEDISKAKETLDGIICQKTREFFEDMSAIGLTAEQVKKYVKEWAE
ncbi:MAG: GntR family transcriptional regulator [Acutalibacteraceae bacterium]|nr:GntR family transcriptional regulator [Acutalibacteraceae bacterium]